MYGYSDAGTAADHEVVIGKGVGIIKIKIGNNVYLAALTILLWVAHLCLIHVKGNMIKYCLLFSAVTSGFVTLRDFATLSDFAVSSFCYPLPQLVILLVIHLKC